MPWLHTYVNQYIYTLGIYEKKNNNSPAIFVFSILVRWQTTQDPLASTVSAGQTTTLPPDVIEVNNIRYHKISDPCFLSRDGVCPMKCTETKSVKADGSKCTMCDCNGKITFISECVQGFRNGFYLKDPDACN
jgi:hypothetical protein